MRAIVAVDANWGIGRDGKLLVAVPEDMAFFKKMTMGHVVIMGKETMLSLPRQAPLRGRINVVLSRSLPETAEWSGKELRAGFVVCSSMDRLFHELTRHEDAYGACKKFVIGGESLYRQLLPYCRRAYVTKLDRAYTADRYFPDLDREPTWRLCEQGDERRFGDLTFCWTTYCREEALMWRRTL